MQRQAVPHIQQIIGTGLENQLASDAGIVQINYSAGRVHKVSGSAIQIKDNFGKITTYPLKICSITRTLTKTHCMGR